MQQEHAALGSVAFGGRFEAIGQVHDRPVQPEDGIAVTGGEIRKEPEAGDLLLVLVYLFGAVRENHVVQALIRRARHLGMFANNIEVFI